MKLLSLVCAVLATTSQAFVPAFTRNHVGNTQLFMAEGNENKLVKGHAKSVTGEELEVMMSEWDTPLVVDAYATWCGPCLLMAPEFEAAAKELEGKVRFVKLDTDVEEQMAGRLNIMGLPTLLFLDKFEDADSDENGPKAMAVLKDRIEGALQKESILALCEHHFFGGPKPETL